MIKFREYLKEGKKGSFLDNKKIPKEEQNVWILSGTFADKPEQGIIKISYNIDRKGLSNTYLDVETKKGIKHLNIAQIFDHKPKKIKVKDEYGEITKWE